MKNVDIEGNEFSPTSSLLRSQRFVSVAYVPAKMDPSKTENEQSDPPTDVATLRNQFQRLTNQSSVSDLDPNTNYLDPNTLPQQTRRRQSQENWTASNLIGVQPVEINPMFRDELMARMGESPRKSKNVIIPKAFDEELTTNADIVNDLIDLTDTNPTADGTNSTTIIVDTSNKTGQIPNKIDTSANLNQPKNNPAKNSSLSTSLKPTPSSQPKSSPILKANVFGVPMPVDLTGTIQSCASTLSVPDQNADGNLSTQGFSPLNSLTTAHISHTSQTDPTVTQPKLEEPVSHRPPKQAFQKRSTGISFDDFSHVTARMPSPQLSPVATGDDDLDNAAQQPPKLSVTSSISNTAAATPMKPARKPIVRSQSFHSGGTVTKVADGGSPMVTNTVTFQPKQNKAEVNVQVLGGGTNENKRDINSRSPVNNPAQVLHRSPATDEQRDTSPQQSRPSAFVETNQSNHPITPRTPRQQTREPLNIDRISIPSTESDLSSDLASSQEEGILSGSGSDLPFSQSNARKDRNVPASVPPLNLPLSARTVQTETDSMIPLSSQSARSDRKSDRRSDKLQMEIALLRSQLQTERDLAFALQNEIRLQETLKHMPVRDTSKNESLNTEPQPKMDLSDLANSTNKPSKPESQSSEEIPTKDTPIKPDPKRLSDQNTQTPRGESPVVKETRDVAMATRPMQSTPSPVPNVIPDRYYRKLSTSTVNSKMEQSHNEPDQNALLNIERAQEIDRLKSTLERANRKNKKLQELVNRQALLMTSIKDGQVQQPGDPITPRTNGFRKQTTSLLEQLDELNQEMDVLEQEIYSKDRQIEQLTRELNVKKRICIKQEENIRLKDECMRKLTLEAKNTATQFKQTISETKKLKEDVNLMQLKLREQEDLNDRLRMEIKERGLTHHVNATHTKKSNSSDAVTKQLKDENKQLRLKLVKATENNNRLRQYLEQQLMNASLHDSYSELPQERHLGSKWGKSKDTTTDFDARIRNNGVSKVTFNRGMSEQSGSIGLGDTFSGDMSWEQGPPKSKLVDANMRLLFAMAEVEDYEQLKKTFTHACLLMDEMEARVKERLHLHQFASQTESLDYDTWREMSRNLDEIQGLNNDARALIFRFWISPQLQQGSGDPTGAQVVGSRDGLMNGDVTEQNKRLSDQLEKYKKEHNRVKQKLQAANAKLKKTAQLRDSLPQDIMTRSPRPNRNFGYSREALYTPRDYYTTSPSYDFCD